MELRLQNDDYKIYETVNDKGNRYYLCIPNDTSDSKDVVNYQICLSLDEDYLNTSDMTLKVSNIYSTIIKRNKNLIYAHMLLDIGELAEAARDNDNPLYNILFQKLYSTYDDARNIFIKEKLAGISNDIGIISQNDDDAKFIDWLEINQALLHNKIERIKLGNNIGLVVDEFEPELPFSDNNDEGFSDDTILSQSKSFVKTRGIASNNHGYGNIVLVIITLAIALVLGIGIAYILIK